MKTRNFFKHLLSYTLSTLFLTGFTGKEKYVELEGHFNGRSSSSFTSSSNIKMTLQAGTRGEILSYNKLPSGNYGIRIKVLNGTQKGNVFWVYHKNNDSDLALYSEIPLDWNNKKSARKAASVDQAVAAETVRETTGNSETQANNDAISLMQRTNEKMQKAGLADDCSDCKLQPRQGHESILRSEKERGVAPACSALMNSQGELGGDGQTLYSIMAEPQYLRHFTKDNALGRYCPRFNELSDSEKLQAWTWFWTALAQEESSCNPQKKHGTTYRDRKGRLRILNPVEGYGLWALERDRNYRRWRGEACSVISTTEGQARCSVDIMMKTQLTGGLSNSESYWGPVRRGNTQIIPHMRRLTLCF